MNATRAQARRRGQPLVALAGVMLAWMALRTLGPIDALLDTPLPLPPTVRGRVDVGSAPRPIATPPRPAATAAPQPVPTVAPRAPEPLPQPPLSAVIAAPPAPPRNAPPPPTFALPRPAEPLPTRPEPSTLPSTAVPFGAVPAEVRARRRWSLDAWLLWRDNPQPGAALVGAGTYGASQAGAVLRYRIAPHSRFDPRAYLRATTTLAGEREVEGAAGIAMRPLRRVPLDLMAEARVLRFMGDPKLRPSETRVRPAVMAVVGPPPIALVAGFRAETYAQVGYIGGEGATVFADGQLRTVRDVPLAGVLPEAFRLEAGAGAWGGAQTGVHRVDVGPSAAVGFPIGRHLFGRVAIDWRQRVAGQAEPGSGPVVTLSAGF